MIFPFMRGAHAAISWILKSLRAAFLNLKTIAVPWLEEPDAAYAVLKV